MTSRNRSLLSSLLVASWVMVAAPAQGQDSIREDDRILGLWLTADAKAHVEVDTASESYCGKIVWLKEPEKNGKPVVDDQNPDEQLRSRPVLGLEIMRGFVYDGDNSWVDGRVYDPESGNEYRGKLELVDENTMELRGYVLIPLFGRTETWTRVK